MGSRRASGESAWRLESTTQQQWCTGYEPGDCCCSHPSSARERLLSRRWLGTSCSPARRRFETASRQCAPQWRCRAHCPSPARTGRTVASALVPRRGTETNRSFFSVHSHLRLDPASVLSRSDQNRVSGSKWRWVASQRLAQALCPPMMDWIMRGPSRVARAQQ